MWMITQCNFVFMRVLEKSIQGSAFDRALVSLDTGAANFVKTASDRWDTGVKTATTLFVVVNEARAGN
jgi:hypothetical protein